MKILVVAPHPDDETLGCGGTLLKHLELGDQVYWLIFTCMSLDNFSKEQIEKRDEEIKKVKALYSGIEVIQLNFEAAKLDTYSDAELIGKVSETFSSIQPELVYIPFFNDAHSDHSKVFSAVNVSIKTFRYPYIKTVRMYETLSETNFSSKNDKGIFYPNYYSDISNYLEQKIKIMEVYKSELLDHPFPRSKKSLNALAVLRGSESGVEYAEGFMTLKEIW